MRVRNALQYLCSRAYKPKKFITDPVAIRSEPRINMDTARGPDSLEEHKVTRENMSSSYEVPKASQSDDARVKRYFVYKLRFRSICVIKFEFVRLWSSRKEYKSEYKKQFRPFSQYEYVDGKFFKKRADQEIGVNPWYKEVIELRQKAGEYRVSCWDIWHLTFSRLSPVHRVNVRILQCLLNPVPGMGYRVCASTFGRSLPPECMGPSVKTTLIGSSSTYPNYYQVSQITKKLLVT